MMQANCIVFPAPKQFKFGQTIRRILLVPRSKNQPYSYYHSEFLDIEEENVNQFSLFLSQYLNVDLGSLETKEQQKPQCMNQDGEMKTMVTARCPKQKIAVKHLLQNYSSVVTQESLPKVSPDQYIPCLFLPGTCKQKLIVFFHANGEDMSSSYEFVSTIAHQLNISLLIMEYRGYSIFEGNANPSNIIEDANRIMEFLLANGIQTKDIIFLGRSIGGAIAFSMGSLHKVASIVMLSPFLSLKKIAKDLYGTCSSALLKQTFDNETNAKQIRSPILLVHGMKDQLVPYEHSLAILSQCMTYTRLHLIENMTHSKFNFRKDFVQPCKNFLADLDIIKF